MSRPPREPEALTNWREFVKEGGRKLRALKVVMSWSLVSWRHMTEGAAETRESLTTLHLSESPKPRTFHESTQKDLKELDIYDTNKHHPIARGADFVK